jgi:hypothetical protein
VRRRGVEYCSANLRATEAPVPGPTPAMMARLSRRGAIAAGVRENWRVTVCRREVGVGR